MSTIGLIVIKERVEKWADLYYSEMVPRYPEDQQAHADEVREVLDSAASMLARAEKWKLLACDALLILQAHAIGQATQAVIQSEIDKEADDPNF